MIRRAVETVRTWAQPIQIHLQVAPVNDPREIEHRRAPGGRRNSLFGRSQNSPRCLDIGVCAYGKPSLLNVAFEKIRTELGDFLEWRPRLLIVPNEKQC